MIEKRLNDSIANTLFNTAPIYNIIIKSDDIESSDLCASIVGNGASPMKPARFITYSSRMTKDGIESDIKDIIYQLHSHYVGVASAEKHAINGNTDDIFTSIPKKCFNGVFVINESDTWDPSKLKCVDVYYRKVINGWIRNTIHDTKIMTISIEPSYITLDIPYKDIETFVKFHQKPDEGSLERLMRDI